MEAGSHQPTTGIYTYEGKTMSTSRRKCPNLTKGMGTDSATFKPKCNGYIGRKDTGKNRRKRRNEPSNNATRGIHTLRRIHATRKGRRKTERYTQS